ATGHSSTLRLPSTTAYSMREIITGNCLPSHPQVQTFLNRYVKKRGFCSRGGGACTPSPTAKPSLLHIPTPERILPLPSQTPCTPYPQTKPPSPLSGSWAS